MKTLLILTLLLIAACGPVKRLRDAYSGHVAATVNGDPIDAKAFTPPSRRQLESRFQNKYHRQPVAADQPEIDAGVHDQNCYVLLDRIEGTLRSQHLKRLGVSVTEADLERVRNPPGPRTSPEEWYKRNHPNAVALVKAWKAIEKGEDPEAVYKRVMYPQRSPMVWAQGEVAGLEKMRNDELVRKEFERRANQTLDEYLGEQASLVAKQARLQARLMANPAAAADYNASILNLATKAKLAEAIDELLSRSDPKFAAYLADSKRRVRTIFAQDMTSYLIDQREEYWFTKVRSQAKIVVNDPDLQSCDISKYIGDAKR